MALVMRNVVPYIFHYTYIYSYPYSYPYPYYPYLRGFCRPRLPVAMASLYPGKALQLAPLLSLWGDWGELEWE